MPTTYRADRVRAVFCLVLGGLFAASGASGIAATDARAPAGFSCLFAAMTLGVGACILMTRVTVSGSGLQKRAPLDGSFRACWDEVESWWVDRGAPIATRYRTRASACEGCGKPVWSTRQTSAAPGSTPSWRRSGRT